MAKKAATSHMSQTERVGFMGVSCPLVIACGLASRLFNAFVGMVTGKERVRF